MSERPTELSPHAQRAADTLGDERAYQTERWVDEVEMAIDEPSVRQLYMSELLVGHQDSAGDFYDRVVEQVGTMAEHERPHVVIMGGLLQGDFKHTQKPRRVTLEKGLDTMDEQFAEARRRINQFTDLDIPVVYNMSPDDHRVAHDYTVEVFREMQDLSKEVGYATQDKMRAHPKWQEHLDFQNRVVFPYCLDKGRALHQGEYYELWEKHHNGEELAPTEFIVTDDVNLTTETEGRTYTDWIRSYMGFSPEPQYQNHLKASVDAVATLAADGSETPDMFVTQHSHEAVGVSNQNAWLVSSGGLLRAKNFLQTRGSRTDARGDISRRFVTTRRRIPEPTSTMHERTDDGRHIVTVFNEALMDKSDSLERMTIAELCDLQTGSITARPDILAKYIDFIRTRAIGERATAIFFGGDMIHGRNYPHFASESQSTGLMSIDAQVRFNEELFKTSLQGITKEELEAIQRIVVQIGNHEWNSGTTKWHGYSFADYMRSVFEREFLRLGYSDEKIKEIITQHEGVFTGNGEVAQAPTSIDKFGDYGVLIQHFLLERGGKGSGGDAPVYHTDAYAKGAGELIKDIDILMAGHWHHPQYGVFHNKLGVIGGSMAGLSGYELWRGYRPTIAGTLLHIGGNQPPQVEFVSEQTLHGHEITTGGLTPAQLKDEGYKDDRDFDPIRHGIMMPRDFPKSALQKRIRHMMQDASERAGRLGELS